MDSIKVSVIIPAHNESLSLQKTLEAVLALDYPDFEVIVVNNASTDTTEFVARAFDTVKVFNEGKKGVQHARQRGVKESTGSIIAAIDADCLPHPNWLKTGVHLLTQSGAVALSGPYDYYDASPVFRKTTLILQKTVYYLVHTILSFFRVGGILIGGNSLIQKHALEQIGGYDTSIAFYGDDTDTAKRLSHVGTLVFSNKLMMQTSARRFKREGMLKILYLYIYNYFKYTFFHP